MKSILILLVFFAISNTVMGQSGLIKANKLHRQNEFSAAIPIYKEIINLTNSVEAIRKIADCYRQINSYREAENWYNMLVQKNFATADDRYAYGQVLMALGKYEAAKQQFQLYARANPLAARGTKMVNNCDAAIRLAAEQPEFRAEAVTKLNSAFSDYGLFPYKNGFIFSTTRQGTRGLKNSTRTGEPFTDLYFVEKLGDKDFKLPINFSDAINTELDEATPCIDPTGKYLYFTRSIIIKQNPDLNPEGIMRLKIYRAENVNGVWTNIEELPFNSDNYSCAHPAISRDGKQLFFTSTRSGGYGGKDIWVSEWVGNQWSLPTNLGPEVNTEGDETFPTLGPDGTLYFSSNFHPGLGGLDIFSAQKVGRSWGNVTNMKAGFNSSADDFGLIYDPSSEKGYVASNRSGGMGGDDIYFVSRLPKPEPPKQEPEIPKASIDGSVVELIGGRDKDGKWIPAKRAGTVTGATLILRKFGSEITRDKSDFNGRFSIKVQNPDEYQIQAQKTGYYVNRVNVTQNDFVNNATALTIELEKVELDYPNPNDKFPPIYYDFDSYRIRDSEKPKLEKATAILKDNPGIKVELAGYTCQIGGSIYNQKLSVLRAEAVAQYLIKNGIESERIIPKGYGQSNFVAKVWKDYHLNRRTEFVIRSVTYSARRNDDVVEPSEDALREPISPEFTEIKQKSTPASQALSASVSDGASRGEVRISDTPVTTPNLSGNLNPEQTNPQTPKPTPIPEKSLIDYKDRYKIDKKGFYTFKKGDTLYGLGRAYNKSVSELMALNNLRSEKIKIGQKIRVN